MFSTDDTHLPICEILAELKLRLLEADELVLQAPPGAGKTTVVPLALLDEPWVAGRRILVLEPRRIAARASAQRMAQLLGENVGHTVGYRIRLDSCTSKHTRIEVITEGVLTRQLQRDPGLEDVALVIFDEFHERNLDSDLCLALALQGRELFREGPPLKLLVMSATLDSEPVAALLGGASLLTSQGRQFPVTTHYGRSYQLREPLAPLVVQAVQHAIANHDGCILVFLPGQREIKQVARGLAEFLRKAELDTASAQLVIAPLYGGLDLKRQQQAIQPAPTGTRKIVLATNVAETSLTIEGVAVVVDSGLVREAVFDAATSMTRLTTRRISRASARQREGRAGRLGPGHCYRLWSEEQDERLVAHTSPAILQADLAPLALQLLAWGVDKPADMAWLDPPPAPAYQQGLAILEVCGALYRSAVGTLQLTPQGVRLAQMPLHPRLAHMLLVANDIQAQETGCLLAAVLSERNPLAGQGVDVNLSLALLRGESRCRPELQGWFRRIWQQARRFTQLGLDSAMYRPGRAAFGVTRENVVGVLLASAYPDRIAQLRPGGDGSCYQLSNGRSAVLSAEDRLAGEAWLAVAEIGGQVGEASDRIYGASPLNPAAFEEILAPLVREEDRVEWDYRSNQFVAQRRRMVGSILLASEPLEQVPEAARGAALLGVLRRKGLAILPWTQSLQQWRARVMLLAAAEVGLREESWPDLTDAALLASLEDWLLPYLGEVRKLQDFQKLDLRGIMHALLPWPLPLELERLAPERLAVPSGSVVAIDYLHDPPVLAVKLQEMFGCEHTPTVADGRVALLIHLLSPAGRPLQVTQDLGGFWSGSYQEVKREMKGRYPKHPWPDNPLQAPATRHTKRRMSAEP
jgi:ATP-dependent helicase HrpB